MNTFIKFIFISLIFLFIFDFLYSQNEIIPYFDIPSYYTDLPSEFREAPFYKLKKIKYYEVRKIYSDEGLGSGYLEERNFYDTNGIPLSKIGMNYERYSTGGHHFDPIFDVDSTFYNINRNGHLDSMVLYYHSGYISSDVFLYDIAGLCIKSKHYSVDSLIRTIDYVYDQKGRLINKGNVEFLFDNDRIIEIAEYNENNYRNVFYEYIYDNKSFTCEVYNTKGMKDKLINRIYFNDKWKQLVKYKINENYDRGKEITRTSFSYDHDGKINKIFVSKTENNIFTDSWEYEIVFDSKGNRIEEYLYDRYGNLLSKYKFIYEFYQ